MKTNSIKTKLITLFTVALVVPLLIIGVGSYQKSKHSLDTLGKTNLKNSVELTLEMIESLDSEVKKGTLSLEEAQNKVKISLLGELKADGTRPINKDIDLGENGYVFVMDEKGNEIAHPFREGDNIWEAKDPNGVLSTQEQIKAANEGGGFVFFEWAMPNDQEVIAPKVTYSAKDPYWGWIINAGTYMVDFNQPAKEILKWIGLVSLITLGIGLPAIWMFASSIANPIHLVSDNLDVLAEGDLTGSPVVVKSTDERGKLASALNVMQSKLREVITNISSAAELVNAQSEELTQSAAEVRSGTEQVSATMQELSSGAERQAVHSSELSMMMVDFDQRVQDANRYGDHIMKASDEALGLVGEGQELMQLSSNQMQKIQEVVKTAVEDVHHLDTQSKQISTLVVVIQEIAEQTNLLALNAAIEAARAGEQGRGFSVVAEEVRKLSDQVASSVTDITGIVRSIQDESRQVSESLEEGFKEVETGAAHVQTTQEKLNQIQQTISNVAENLGVISENLSGIATNSHEMNGTAQEMAAIAQESAAGIEQTSAAAQQTTSSMEEVAGNSEQLSQLAEQLNKLVMLFNM